MDIIPIETRIMNAFRPKDRPTGICPECDVEEAAPREAVVEWLRGLEHTEDDAREIEQSMFELAREMMGRKDDPKPQKEN